MALLFCYGSNDPAQLAHRLGHKRFTVEAAWADGYERVFRGFSSRWRGGTASLRKRAGGTTYGFLAEVSADDLATLDRFEGVHMHVYERVKIPVETDSGKAAAYAYVHLSTEFNRPSLAYLQAVAKTINAFWTGSRGGKVFPEDIPIR